MGYEVYITRKETWFDEDGDAISLDDWLAYVERDPDMRADAYAEATTPDGSTIRMEDPGIAVWTAYSGHDDTGNMAWFMHREDCVSVKNPDVEIMRKMHTIATALGGSLQGEEGEQYGPDGEALDKAPPDTAHASPPAAVTRPWWKFWS